MGDGQRYLPESKLDTKAVAHLLGRSERTVKRWRKRGYGPPYYKVNEEFGQPSIIYQYSDVQAWLARHRHTPASRSPTT